MRTLLLLIITMMSIPAVAETIAIKGGKLHTISNGYIDNGTIVIEDGVITAVGNNIDIPDGARVIDATGKHVTPGFMGSYSYLGLSESTSSKFPNDHSGEDSIFSAAFDVKYALNPHSNNITENRRQGITRSVTAPSSSGDIFTGQSVVITLDNQDDMIVREGPMFAKLSEGGNRSMAFVRLRAILDQVQDYSRNKSRAMRGQAQEYILPFADMDALIPVVEGDKKLVLEVGNVTEIKGAIAIKKEYGIDIVLIGAQEGWKAAEELAAANIPVIIDVEHNTFENVTIPGATFSNAARMEAAGVKVAFYHTSINSVYYIIQFAGIAVAHGMTYEGALAALSKNAAEIFGIDDRYGTLSIGMDGDVVVWDGDPLDVTSNTDHVLVRGVEYELVSRRTLLRDRYLNLKDGRPFGARYK